MAVALSVAASARAEARALAPEGPQTHGTTPAEAAEPDATTTPPATEPARPRAEPWRVAPAVHSPAWLDFGATQRTRYEYLHQDFRTRNPGDQMGLSLRTTLRAELRSDSVFIGAEAIDSRLLLAIDEDTIDTTHADPLDLLQRYVGAELTDVGRPGSTLQLRAGRMTMDVGSRRLVARNRFRNTINAFTGVDVAWTSPRDDTVRVFATLPVQRRPSSSARLARGGLELDQEDLGAVLWGAFYGSRPWAAALRGEAYLIGLHEQDSARSQTRNRRLFTPGLRLLRAPTPGKLDVELETMLQLGHSRASTQADDLDDLRHVAYFGHGAIGYTIDVPWSPRPVVQYDYASGDADPNDDTNGRFDTLYGARRFEFGPTGIYGAIARSNIDSPGLRLELRPHRTVDAFVGYRAVYLARARDAWTTSGVRDPSGASGHFVGNQLEGRLRWRPLPGNIVCETGVAHAWLGGMAVAAPNATGNGNPTFVYAQLGFEI